MHIDFHHAATYICARLAGFDQESANIVAYSCQYVDDATNSGEIIFDNGGMYSRISSAHKMVDHRNLDDYKNHKVWLPFHFLPGNNAQPAPNEFPHLNEDEFISRCICRPNSYVARDMMHDVIRRQNRPYALHRLGIASHVFLDTWAHQGFVGEKHHINKITNIDADDNHHNMTFHESCKNIFDDWCDETKSRFIGAALPLGHGSALTYPDLPYLRWSYTNGQGEHIVRNNPADFFEAAKELFTMFAKYLAYAKNGEESLSMPPVDLPIEFEKIQSKIVKINHEDSEHRHQEWLNSIENGDFGFEEKVTYIPKGAGSWKHQALGTERDIGDEDIYRYSPHFINSDWKKFHDALQAHRFYILNELLPRYGLVAA